MRWVCALLLVGLLVPASASAAPTLSRDIYGYNLTLEGGDDGLAVRAAGSLLEFAPSGPTAVPWSIQAANCMQDPQTYVVDCPAGGVPLNISAGAGADTIDGSASPVTLSMVGGAGRDTLTGSPGNDTFSVRDNEADSVDCGAGSDSVAADAGDTTTNCESVSVPPPSSSPPPSSGGGASPSPSPSPGTSSPPSRIDAKITSSFAPGRTFTRVLRLSVSGAPAGATIRLTCKGKGKDCPRKSLSRSGPATSFTTTFKKAHLRPSTLVEVRITAPGRTGRVVRFTTRKGKAPKRVVLCLAPGASAPAACG